MNAIIPLKNIRKKENNKRKIEIKENLNQREQLNLLLADNSDTSSDYNSNFIDFPNNEMPLFDIKKIRDFHGKQINEKANFIKGKDLSLSKKILVVLNEMNTIVQKMIMIEYMMIPILIMRIFQLIIQVIAL